MVRSSKTTDASATPAKTKSSKKAAAAVASRVDPNGVGFNGLLHGAKARARAALKRQ